MKKLACLLLALWFGLVAGLAQAHAMEEDLHRLEHAVAGNSAAGSAAPAHDASHEEHCGMAHCSHIPAMAVNADRFTTAPQSASHFASVRRHTSWFVPDDIERPKWPASTPAVASL